MLRPPSALARAGVGAYTPRMLALPRSAYAARRQAILDQLPEGGAMLLPTNPERLRAGDSHFPFRPHSDFYYATGFPEPEAWALLKKEGEDAGFTMIVLPKNPEREVWTGIRFGTEGCKDEFGADHAHSTDGLEAQLARLLTDVQTLYFSFGRHPEVEPLLTRVLNKVRSGRKAHKGPSSIVDAGAILTPLRLHKTADELVLMRRGAEITHEAHVEAMKQVRPGMREYEIQALVEYRVGRVALEWLKGATGSASGSELDPREGSGWRLDGEELDLQQLGVAWARRHVEGIERGRFDLQPESCPMVESSARCDFERVCGFDPDTADRRPARLRLLLEEVPPPDEDEGGGDEPTQLPPLLPPIGDPDPDPAADRATHDAAQLVIADASKDAVVSAGAGTGKTWNLVRRYEAALDSVGDPQRILCVTFTRRAAGEMKARIRAQLLGRDDLDDAVLRGLVLELSSAPLWTLDALALRIVQEASAGAMPQVSEGGGLNADLQAFVSERFIEALDAGDDDLNLLLDHVAPAPARAALTAAVKAEFGEGFTDAAAVETLWEECAQPYLEAVRAFAEEIDATQGLHNVAAMKPDGKEALVERAVIALEACAALANPSARSATNPWPLVGHLKRMPGVSGLRQPLKRWIEESWVPAWAEFEAELGSRKKTFDALAKGADFGSWSEILAAAARLSSGWSADLREDLDRRGTLRYADVERRPRSAASRRRRSGPPPRRGSSSR